MLAYKDQLADVRFSDGEGPTEGFGLVTCLLA